MLFADKMSWQHCLLRFPYRTTGHNEAVRWISRKSVVLLKQNTTFWTDKCLSVPILGSANCQGNRACEINAKWNSWAQRFNETNSVLGGPHFRHTVSALSFGMFFMCDAKHYNILACRISWLWQWSLSLMGKINCSRGWRNSITSICYGMSQP